MPAQQQLDNPFWINIRAILIKELLTIVLGIVLLGLILIPSLINSKNQIPQVNVQASNEHFPESVAEDNTKVNHELFMCRGVDNGTPIEISTVFSTADKIHCLVKWHGISNGKHTTEFHWINPQKQTQEYYEHTFTATCNDYDVWSWLRLDEGSIFAFDSFDFVGEWRIEVFLDDGFFAKKKFTIN
jgi:hypothetical protein